MSTLESIEQILAGQGSRPPIEKWHPALSGDIDIRIGADGRWFHEGDEIRRQTLVNLFASILRREDDGDYYLVTPVEKWRVQVEDLPLLVVDIESIDAPRRVVVKTNVDTWFEIDAEHSLLVEEDANGQPMPSVYTCHGLWARVNRVCFYRLVELAKEDGEYLYVESAGQRFLLGSVA